MAKDPPRPESTTRGGSDQGGAEAPPTLQLGSVSRYLVLEEVGRGGMGVVQRGYDPELQREVALKLVRADRLETSAQTRLVREAQALAQISHPNVIAVFDVAVLDSGDIVLVMEYVRGETLRSWLSAAERSVDERLRALVAAGRGLAAAHARGLIHRDFKLSNVLVGDDGRVRVMDFGLARLAVADGSPADHPPPSASTVPVVDEAHTDRLATHLTEDDVVVGTPAYMPPEQLRRSRVDARADQYAFCLACWYALAGRWPFGEGAAGKYDVKTQGPPPWPDDSPEVPRAVREALQRGLEPKPELRWPSMDALLSVLERKPGKRRALVLLGLAALATGAAFGVRQLQEAERVADCEAEGASIEAVWSAQRQRKIARGFEHSGITYAAEAWGRARNRVGEFARAWQLVRTEACQQAAAETTLAAELATAARACLDAQSDSLDALLDQLVDVDRAVVNGAVTATADLPTPRHCLDPTQLRLLPAPAADADADARDRARAVHESLARARALTVVERLDPALAHAEDALARAEGLSQPALVAEARLTLALTLDEMGRYPEAFEAARATYFAASEAGQDALALRAASEAAYISGYRLADPEEGLRWARVGRTVLERLDAPGELGARLASVTGVLQRTRGELDAARESYDQALAICEKAFGPEHPRTAAALNNLANLYSATGKGEDALALHERALAIREKAFGPEHPAVAGTLSNIGVRYYEDVQPEKAREYYERAQSVYEKTLGPDHPHVAQTLTNLGHVYVALDAPEKAQAAYERALRISEETLGSDHPRIAYLLAGLANVALTENDLARAVRLSERVLDLRERAGVSPPLVAEAQFMLARAAIVADASPDRALRLAQQARQTYAEAGEPYAVDLARVDAWLASNARRDGPAAAKGDPHP